MKPEVSKVQFITVLFLIFNFRVKSAKTKPSLAGKYSVQEKFKATFTMNYAWELKPIIKSPTFPNTE